MFDNRSLWQLLTNTTNVVVFQDCCYRIRIQNSRVYQSPGCQKMCGRGRAQEGLQVRKAFAVDNANDAVINVSDVATGIAQ